MESLIGAPPAAWIFVVLVLFAFAALATGRALAITWRPWWQAVPYTFLLAATARFCLFALFGGTLLHLVGLLVDWAILAGLSNLAFRAARTQLMVRQYPWLYEKSGPFGWREKA